MRTKQVNKPVKLETPIEPKGTITHVPSLSESVKHFTFTENGVTVDKSATLDDVVNVSIDLLEKAKSATVNCAHLLRYARDLGKVKMPDGKESEAFAVVKHRIAQRFNTESSLNNCVALMPLLDIAEKNALTVSPFVIKEAIGTLKAMGSLGEDNAIIVNDDSKAIVDALTVAPKGVNAIREVVKTAKKAKDERLAKEVADAIIKKQDAQDIKDPIVAKAVEDAHKKEDEAKAIKAGYTPEIVNRQIQSIIGIWEKTVATEIEQGRKGVETTRSACKESIDILARLAGYKLVLL